MPEFCSVRGMLVMPENTRLWSALMLLDYFFFTQSGAAYSGHVLRFNNSFSKLNLDEPDIAHHNVSDILQFRIHINRGPFFFLSDWRYLHTISSTVTRSPQMLDFRRQVYSGATVRENATACIMWLICWAVFITCILQSLPCGLWVCNKNILWILWAASAAAGFQRMWRTAKLSPRPVTIRSTCTDRELTIRPAATPSKSTLAKSFPSRMS